MGGRWREVERGEREEGCDGGHTLGHTLCEGGGGGEWEVGMGVPSHTHTHTLFLGM